jgi:YVTN family beta-propeller protein
MVSLGTADAQADTVFIANENGQSVSIIDTETSSTVTVAIPISPHNVDITADGRLLLATGMAVGDHAAHGRSGGGQLVLMDVSGSAPAAPTIVAVGGHPAHVVPDAQGRFAYLTDADTSSVVVVDLASRNVAKRVPVQNYPHGLRLSPDGSLLAVANMKSGTVSLVDTRDLEKVEHVPVGRVPVQVAFDASGRTLVVSLNGENKIAIIDVASRKVVRTAAVGRGPVQVFVTQDGKRALVANQGSAAKPDDRVSVVSLDSGDLIKNVTVGKGAHGVVIDRDGDTAYITNTYENTASSIDLKSLTVEKTYPVGKGPNGIAAR